MKQVFGLSEDDLKADDKKKWEVEMVKVAKLFMQISLIFSVIVSAFVLELVLISLRNPLLYKVIQH